MRLVPHSNSNGYQVFMEPHECDTMVECASRDRAEIAFRLGAECSLRKKEVLDVTLDKIQKSRSPGVRFPLCACGGRRHGKRTVRNRENPAFLTRYERKSNGTANGRTSGLHLLCIRNPKELSKTISWMHGNEQRRKPVMMISSK